MTWFRNLNTASKLLTGFVFLSLLSVLAGYLALSRLERSNQMLEDLYSKHLVGLRHIGQAHVWQLHAARAVRSAVLAGSREEAERHTAEIEKNFTQLGQELDQVEPTLIRAEGKALMATIRGVIPEWQGQIRGTARLNLDGKRAEALELMKQARTNGDRLQAAFEGLTEQKVQVGEEAHDSSQALYKQSRLELIAIAIIGLVVGVGLGMWIGRMIGGPLAQAVQVLEAVAGRDFTQRLEVDSRDEVGRMASALNEALDSLQGTLTEVRDVADAVATASRQLSSSAEEIASGAQEQASSLEESAANLEEITSTVKQNADNAQHASQLGSSARDTAERGGAVVSSAVQAMGEINKSSKRIAEIITTIDEIAFQTNLLALNAAVEAARAGEQGRGFAVVAAEVRNLAQRSATAAKEIKGLIQDSVQRVEGGSELVNQSGQQLQEIVTSVKRVTDLVAEMSSASREQSTGIDQVNKAVSQMDQVTQANSAQTEELSSTAEAMSRQADQLRALVSQFRLGSDSHHRPRPTVAHQPARPAVHQPARRPTSSLRRAAGGDAASGSARTPVTVAGRRTAAPAADGGHAPAHKLKNGSSDLDAAMVAALSTPADGGKDGEFEDV
jgi:methyl-accepting chemotaxis protein